MGGLRDRKKRDTRHRLIGAAAELFAAKGLAATTVEDVAAAADVSVGTVYNYFGTKTALLVAAVEEDTTAMVAQGAAVLARPGPDPVAAVQRLFGVYLDAFTGWDPALLREVMNASMQRTGGAELTVELVRMDEQLMSQLTQLLTWFADRGMLHQDVASAEATLLLFSALVTHIFMYLSIPGFDAAALRGQVDRYVEIAFTGLAAHPQKEAE
jgi:AcrR family transcriptional regulator